MTTCEILALIIVLIVFALIAIGTLAGYIDWRS